MYVIRRVAGVMSSMMSPSPRRGVIVPRRAGEDVGVHTRAESAYAGPAPVARAVVVYSALLAAFIAEVATTMFVRFRSARRRLQASLIETRRIEGKVCHEHIASLGSINAEPSVADRIEFWRRLHERFGQLANRLDAAAQSRAMYAVHAKVPMPTVEEVRALQLANAEADERFWQQFAEMQTEQAQGNSQLAANAERAASKAKAQAASASVNATTAKERIERLNRGEAVSGGIGKPFDPERLFREAGWTTADFKRARITNAISQLGGFEELLDEIGKRHGSRPSRQPAGRC